MSMEALQKQEEERRSVKRQRTDPASPLDEADRDEPNAITDSNPPVDGPSPQVPSSDAPPSPPQSSMPSGVIAIAKMNAKHRFFLASTDNSFAGHKVDKIMIDSGSSLMLPLSPGDLLTFPARYPGSSHVWRISHSNGVSHLTVVLIIHLKNDLPMPVFLCSDLIPQQVPTTTKYLRFHLCTDDMNLLLNTPILSSMFVVDDKLQRVSTYLNLHHPSVPQKVHALLGQSILHPNITIQYEDTMVLFAPGLFEPVKFWDSMVYLTRTLLKNNSQLLPEHFDDLEDEDHVDIDTDQEDYHLFDDWNAIDETE